MKFFNPRNDIEKTRHNLPHWQQGETAISVMCRLADSMPQEVLNCLRDEREAFMRDHPLPWDEATETLYHARFTNHVEEYLDKGHGSCALRNAQAARIVADRLHHFDTQRYDLWSYVIMPNHVHVLFSPREDVSLSATVQGWKGVSSHLIHRHGLSELEPFWQADYHDRLVRNLEHFRWVADYIRQNPIVARLRPGSYVVWVRNSILGG